MNYIFQCQFLNIIINLLFSKVNCDFLLLYKYSFLLPNIYDYYLKESRIKLKYKLSNFHILFNHFFM